MTKRVIDALAIKCYTTLTQAMVDAHPEVLPEAVVQALAKHPKLQHQLMVAKGDVCEDTAIEIVKGDGTSVIVQIKETGTGYVRFFMHMLHVLEMDPRSPLVEKTVDAEFAHREDLASFFYNEFGSGANNDDGKVNKYCYEIEMVGEILNDWDYQLLEVKLTDEENSRVHNWCTHDASEDGEIGHPDPDFMDWYHPLRVEAVVEQFDGGEPSGKNRLNSKWFDALVEKANARPANAWVPTPLQRFIFGWL